MNCPYCGAENFDCETDSRGKCVKKPKVKNHRMNIQEARKILDDYFRR